MVDRITELTVGGGALGTGHTPLPQSSHGVTLPLPVHVPRLARTQTGPDQHSLDGKSLGFEFLLIKEIKYRLRIVAKGLPLV